MHSNSDGVKWATLDVHRQYILSKYTLYLIQLITYNAVQYHTMNIMTLRKSE